MPASRLSEVWVYLAASPLLWLTLTLVAYQAAYALYRRAAFHPLLNPVPVAVTAIALVLALARTPYDAYFAGAQFVHFLLGPAVVALAVPLAKEWHTLRRLALPLGAALAVGATVAASSCLAIAWLLGASHETLLSLAPKSVTTPIAMGIAQELGGLPALAAVFAVTTGVIGAATGKYVLDALGIDDWRVRGFALGVAAHGIGTARAFQVNAEAGAYAGLGFGLHGVLAAVLFPLVYLLVRQVG